MKRLALAWVLAPASLVGPVALAAPARADDVDVGLFFGAASGGHGRTRGFFGIDLRRSFEVERARVDRMPRVVPGPYAPLADPTGRWGSIGPVEPAPPCGCPTWIPAHEVCREEVVCEPAVYEDRCVPVFETVQVPVYDTVCVPVYEDVGVPVYASRRVPVYDRVIDPRTGRPRKVLVGERLERVQVGERTERRQVGERHEPRVVGARTERVRVGERTEHVLVRAETKRVVVVKDRVPGRFVTVVDGPGAPRTGPGEVLTRAEYEAEMAVVAGAARDTDAAYAGGPRRGPPIPRSVPIARR